jgi:hypothetical protein
VLLFFKRLALKYSGIEMHAVHEPSKSQFRLKVMAFWLVTPASLVEVGRRFRHAYCLHQGDECEGDSLLVNGTGALMTTRSSETTRRSVPECCHPYESRREN